MLFENTLFFQFDKELKGTWDAAADAGYFTYKLDNVEGRVASGKYSLYIQVQCSVLVYKFLAFSLVHCTNSYDQIISKYTLYNPSFCPMRKLDVASSAVAFKACFCKAKVLYTNMAFHCDPMLFL